MRILKLLTKKLREHLSQPAHWVDALVVFVPVAIILALAHGNETTIFVTAALGIVPLAGFLGEATDALSERVGQQAGALLNATFGNAAELIITIAAIRAGLLEVVKASITGSIVGNILLVLGLSLLAGGIKNGLQKFSLRRASVSVTTMVLAVIALVIPALFGFSQEGGHEFVITENLSIGVSLALMVGYGLTILYTFRMGRSEEVSEAEEETDGVHFEKWNVRTALGVLFVAVVFVAILSEILVEAVEPLIRAQGLTELFVGVIIVPIIGNAAEHLVAVEMAWKNKAELSLGIAMGSSVQIALFVAPLLVFIALALGQPMTLLFNPVELAALGASVVIAALIALDGESNWLEGAQLLLVYVILALAFFFLPA